MTNYFVNDNTLITGVHEVHREGCPRLTMLASKTILGYHLSDIGAIVKARTLYSNVKGCAACCNDYYMG